VSTYELGAGYFARGVMKNRLHRWFSNVWRYIKAILPSFYSSALYAEVVKRWQGLGVGYLLLLVILGSIPLSGRVILAFDEFFKEEILFPVKALPPLTIKNGEVIYNQPMPHWIKNKRGAVVAIIDTTGAVSGMPQAYPQLVALITKHKVMIRPPGYKQFLGLATDNLSNPIHTQSFDKGLNGVFSGAAWIQASGISRLNTLIKILIFPCVVVFYFSFFCVLLFLLSALAQLYSDIFFRLKLPFKATCRLLTVAATPVLVLFFFMRYSNIVVPGIILDYGVILLAYISFGLYSVKRLSV